MALSLFNLLQFPMTMLPFLISSTVQASVSVKRLSNFLKSDELDPNMVEWNPEPAGGRWGEVGAKVVGISGRGYDCYVCVSTEDEPAMTISDGTFSWDSEDADKATLRK